jgi:hypothetical protein
MLSIEPFLLRSVLNISVAVQRWPLTPGTAIVGGEQ